MSNNYGFHGIIFRQQNNQSKGQSNLVNMQNNCGSSNHFNFRGLSLFLSIVCFLVCLFVSVFLFVFFFIFSRYLFLFWFFCFVFVVFCFALLCFGFFLLFFFPRLFFVVVLIGCWIHYINIVIMCAG